MESGNPYHDWLGLPREFESPNHYQLLQLNPAECSRDAIVAAAKSQLAKLRAAGSTSANRDELKRLAKQIESAANCLASAKSREKYNHQLLAALTSAVPGPPAGNDSQSSPPTQAKASSTSQPESAAAGESLPVAIPIDDASESAPIGPAPDQTPWELIPVPVARQPQSAGDDSPSSSDRTVLAVADPGLHRRRRRATPWTAYIAIVAALVLLAGAVLLAVQPQLIERWLGRAPAVADSDATDRAPTDRAPTNHAPEDATPSPLDRVVAMADSKSEDSAKSPVESTAESTAESMAESPAESTAATEDSPVPVDVTSSDPVVGPADESANAIDPPPRPQLAPATVELLLSATLYSLAVGNFDESIEIFSQIDTAQLPPELADRADRLAFVADAHQRFEQQVQLACETISGGETLEMPGSRSIGVVEASGELVVYRAAGTNRRYPPKLLPAEIGLAFAQRAGANPNELVVMEATESVLQEARRTLRGRPRGFDQLLAAFSRWRANSNAQADLGLLEEFVRMDLEPLLALRQDKSFWAQTSSDPQPWLDPLPPTGDVNYSFLALAQSLDQPDPNGRAVLYRQAMEQWFAQQHEAVGLAIAATMGQFGDPAGRASLLALFKLDRISKDRATRLIHILLDRIAHEDGEGRAALVRICQQIVEKFGLENYGYVLAQFDSEGN